MKIEQITTPAIDGSGDAVKESRPLSGIIGEIRIDVLVAAGTVSTNSTVVVITDNVFERTILSVTLGSGGLKNLYYPLRKIDNTSGTTQAFYDSMSLASQRLTVTISSATATDFVKVWIGIKDA